MTTMGAHVHIVTVVSAADCGGAVQVGLMEGHVT